MIAEFSMPQRVYIEDTDAGGIVYYVNYLKYFERARTELMRAQGFAKAAMIDDDLLFVVSDLQINYRQPAAITGMGGATLTFAQAVYRGESCLVDGVIRIAAVSQSTGKPQKLPAAMREGLTAQRSNLKQP
jgi:4-hydroxybenzoyl-CoA thioesterase